MCVKHLNNLLRLLALLATVVGAAVTHAAEASESQSASTSAGLPELRLPNDLRGEKQAWRKDWPKPWHGKWDALQVRRNKRRDMLLLEMSESPAQEDAAPHRAVFEALKRSQVYVRLNGEDSLIALPLSKLNAKAQRAVVAYHNERMHQSPPEWLEGYAVRFKVALGNDLFTQPAATVTVTLPTGGWLNEAGDDIAVVANDGTELPVVVLSHDPIGDTTIQFRRYQYDTVYWVYAINPDAQPGDLVRFEKDPEALRREAEQATLKMMAAQREAGKLTGERQELAAKVEQQRKTRQEAQKELDEWAELLPERKSKKQQAAEALEQAEKAHTKAAKAHEEPGRIAREKTDRARKLTRAAQSARREAEQAQQAHEQAKQELAAARAAVEEAEQAHQRAMDRHESALAQVADAEKSVAAARAGLEKDDLTEEQRKAAEARLRRARARLAEAEASAEKTKQSLASTADARAVAPQRVEAAKQAVEKSTDAVRRKQAAAQSADAKAKPAEQAAREARLAAAPTANRLEEAKKGLRQAQSRAKRADKLVTEANRRIEEVEQIKADAEAVLAELEPSLKPVAKAANTAQKRAREAAARAEQKQERYRKLAYEADPRVFREGMTVEYRRWAGDKLGEWPVVVTGLQQSQTVTDNAIVSSIYQDKRLFRTNSGGNFAASYRGYLKIDKAGVYSFFANAEDTIFLFINGYRVYSRTGTNEPFSGSVPTFSLGADMQLEEGVHPIEVHHVVGNTLNTTGRARLLWIPPGEESWSFVPRSAFTRSALGVPVALEAADGDPVAFIRYGVDEKLSVDGTQLWLTRFQAISDATNLDPERLQWTFDDGTRRTGRSVRHVFFQPGDTIVKLKSHPDIPPFQRRAHVKAEPNPLSAHALKQTVRTIGGMAHDQLAAPRLNEAYHFLRICAQRNRWPVMEQVARELLSREGIDIKHRVLLHGSLMRALAHQGRGSDAVALLEDALAAADGVRTLRARAMLDAANVHRDVLRNLDRADALYERIINENSRLRHPIVREAAIAWGDLYLDAGDLARAGEAYRMGRRLGEIGAGPARSDPIKRGTLLRVAEQQLQGDDVRQSLRMLQRIERNYPEQKLDGLYRFLRGEADRHAGDYGQAIRNYEVVLHLSEWASYHPHALRGIADSYYRMGEFERAVKWYANLRNRYGQLYRRHKLDQKVNRIRQRLNAMKEQSDRSDGANVGALFASLQNGFESGAASDRTARTRLTMGFDGPGTFMVRRDDGQVSLPTMKLEHLPTQGSLWVEFWVRTRLGDVARGAYQRYTHVSIQNGGGNQIAQKKVHLPRTFGAWRKVAFEFEAPRTRNGQVQILVRSGGEMLEIDAVQIDHVSDTMSHNRRRFLDGADPQ